ncbi:hypothetical protein KYB31_15460 [Clostridium felsineum]|uniref:hypothetical protein n=1 Tax=Clostridium felsineum TaxID=36839 RepID=UPI00214D2616|nr:hypothetical protein [Clostridium felsineum]MCR3760374.1 hypothetical protein [Clostridium felsineum]
MSKELDDLIGQLGNAKFFKNYSQEDLDNIVKKCSSEIFKVNSLELEKTFDEAMKIAEEKGNYTPESKMKYAYILAIKNSIHLSAIVSIKILIDMGYLMSSSEK